MNKKQRNVLRFIDSGLLIEHLNLHTKYNGIDMVYIGLALLCNPGGFINMRFEPVVSKRIKETLFSM